MLSNKTKNRAKGIIGETLALQYLKKHGYKIIKQNYTCPIGEIDIIASKKRCIVFVEVKARESDAFGRPGEAVNYYKQQKIRKVATTYLKFNKKIDASCRFDVIEILGDEINHIENAF